MAIDLVVISPHHEFQFGIARAFSSSLITPAQITTPSHLSALRPNPALIVLDESRRYSSEDREIIQNWISTQKKNYASCVVEFIRGDNIDYALARDQADQVFSYQQLGH